MSASEALSLSPRSGTGREIWYPVVRATVLTFARPTTLAFDRPTTLTAQGVIDGVRVSGPQLVSAAPPQNCSMTNG